MKFLTSRPILATAAVLVIAGGGAAIATAQGSSASSSGFLASVAKHLGISTEKLKDATKAAALDQVDADLEAGRITKAQADALKARINAGQLPFFGGPRFGFHHGPGGFHHHLAAAEEYLGLSAEQLRQKLQSGQSLADVARAQDKSVDGLKEAMLADAKEHLDEAVEDGMLTRSQADAKLERLRSHIDDIVNGTPPRLRGGHRFEAPPQGAAFWDVAA